MGVSHSKKIPKPVSLLMSNVNHVNPDFVSAILNDDELEARRIISDDHNKLDYHGFEDNNCYNRKPLHHSVKAQCILLGSPYFPDTPWCLAAVYNARKVMKVLWESTGMASQVGTNYTDE